MYSSVRTIGLEFIAFLGMTKRELALLIAGELLIYFEGETRRLLWLLLANVVCIWTAVLPTGLWITAHLPHLPPASQGTPHCCHCYTTSHCFNEPNAPGANNDVLQTIIRVSTIPPGERTLWNDTNSETAQLTATRPVLSATLVRPAVVWMTLSWIAKVPSMAQFPIGPLTLSLTQCALERTETGTRDTTVAAVITETTVRNRFTRLIHNLAGSSGCSKRIGLAAVRNRNKQTVQQRMIALHHILASFICVHYIPASVLWAAHLPTVCRSH